MTKIIIDGKELDVPAEYTHKADIDDAGILDPVHMVAAE